MVVDNCCVLPPPTAPPEDMAKSQEPSSGSQETATPLPWPVCHGPVHDTAVSLAWSSGSECTRPAASPGFAQFSLRRHERGLRALP